TPPPPPAGRGPVFHTARGGCTTLRAGKPSEASRPRTQGADRAAPVRDRGRRDAKPQTALSTLPALRQRVHTYSRRGVSPTMMRTFWRFGLKRRLVATIEWLRLCPNAGPLWHT